MTNKIIVHVGWKPKEYEVIDEPIPHILVDSKKELHGWWRGKRECTGERMLVNPYNGCTYDCFFCYARALGSYFNSYEKDHVVTVFRNFDQEVSKQLDSVNYASCGYLSPVTDPFQPLNSRYHLTEKIIAEFVNRNIPVEFITKGRITDEAIDLLSRQKHSFGQVSILTLNEDLRRKMVPGGAPTATLLDNIKRLHDKNIHTVVRIDPVFPYITDNHDELERLIVTVKGLGAAHIIVSCVDIPVKMKAPFFRWIEDNFGPEYANKYRHLYTEVIGTDFNASIDYRREMFTFLKETCKKHQITMALCMEYEKTDAALPKGLNAEFMTSKNCEGIDVPLYKYTGRTENGYRQFEPAPCSNKGNCLTCEDPACGIRELAMGRCYLCKNNCKVDFTLQDYRRWSKPKEEQTMLNRAPRRLGYKQLLLVG